MVEELSLPPCPAGKAPHPRSPQGRTVARILVWVRPGSRSDAIEWDPWRHRWTVSCRAAPTEGRANRAVAELVAGWLGVPLRSARWERSGRSRSKVLEVEGIGEVEADRRLHAVAGTARDPSTSPGGPGAPGG